MTRSFSQGGRVSGASGGTTDGTVEEQLAAGASVDDLIASGALYDDYDPTSDDYDFTPLPSEEDQTPERTRSREEIDAWRARMHWFTVQRRLGKDAPPMPPRYVQSENQ